MRLRFSTFLAAFHPAGENPMLAFRAIKEQAPERMPGQRRKAS